MRVAFLGNDAWSAPALRSLADRGDMKICAVFTRPPVPTRRGGGTVPTPVGEAARELGLPLREVATVCRGEGREALEASQPEVLAVVAYGEILPEDVLAIASIAPLNLHFSLLPIYRGAAPVQRALLDGCAVTGVTVMRMDAGMDTGPILAQEEIEILDEDDAGSLGARLAERGAGLLAATVASVGFGAGPEPREQDDASATDAPRIEQRDIDWREPADRILGLVRALAPVPGAATTHRGRRLKLLRVDVADGEGPPGTLLRDEPSGPVVAAAPGGIRLIEVAPAGRRRMSGAEFARGARLAAGDVFGDSA